MARLQSKIRFSSRQVKVLKRLGSRRNLEAGVSGRVSILVLGLEGMGLVGIAARMGVSKTTVRAWRARWIASHDELCTFEAGLPDGEKGDRKLELRILEILADKPRSGAPRTFTMEQDKMIVALACRNPREFSLPMNLWTNDALAAQAVKEGIVSSISTVQVWNVLKKYAHAAAQEQVLDAPENRRPQGV
jgi:transposase